jgi:polyisoprenoid-binding protein YceI
MSGSIRTARLACALLVWLPCAAARGAELALSPERTTITFELDSTLHRVHGTARLLPSALRFEPDGGAVSGRIAIDAASLDTGNGLRDRHMHGKVLESERYPRIEFVPDALVVEERAASRARIALEGRLRIHGGEFSLTVPAEVSAEGDGLRVVGSFRIPYVDWGMRDPSNFVLSVDREVLVHFDALAEVAPPAAALAAEVSR